jgi:hypothetical protein
MRLLSRLQAQHGHAINRLASGVIPSSGSPHKPLTPEPGRQNDQPMNASGTVTLAPIGTMIRDDDDDQRETDDHTWT